MKTRTITLLLIALFFVACESEKEKEKEMQKEREMEMQKEKEKEILDQNEFKITKEGYNITKSATKEPIAITSYSIYYNPVSRGKVIIKLEDGSEYTSQSLEGGNLSAAILLLKDARTVFYPVRKELVIKEVTDK